VGLELHLVVYVDCATAVQAVDLGLVGQVFSIQDLQKTLRVEVDVALTIGH
jgi:hypothetical protein